jgi:hypothetical protein
VWSSLPSGLEMCSGESSAQASRDQSGAIAQLERLRSSRRRSPCPDTATVSSAGPLRMVWNASASPSGDQEGLASPGGGT